MKKSTLYHIYANLFAVGKIREMVECDNVSFIRDKYLKYKEYIDENVTCVDDLLFFAYSEMKKQFYPSKAFICTL